MRYTIFGVRNDIMIESQAKSYVHATIMALATSCAGYKARIWDNEGRSFVPWGN